MAVRSNLDNSLVFRGDQDLGGYFVRPGPATSKREGCKIKNSGATCPQTNYPGAWYCSVSHQPVGRQADAGGMVQIGGRPQPLGLDSRICFVSAPGKVKSQANSAPELHIN
jgi:hypothetical protein